ncbi:hypothetical protein [Methanobrevibacter curvatus]|uniref:Uncharacterized protein n=1 Tax=Methanobrevibacter curvatus TaxID=49547 RepID=A0A166C8H1_9EURY|nr:hypothetical protein [Methanobrevibacter curvatus]KZX12187.1 hypothetical protein MBCUR_11370 [Methanobrevibacter curvatus]
MNSYIIIREQGNPKKIQKIREAYKKIERFGLFDEKYYLDKYPHIKKSKIKPLDHYVYHGYKEGKNPSKEFDGNYYLKKYKDVKKAQINPLIHYALYGKEEGKYPNKTAENNSVEGLLKREKKVKNELIAIQKQHQEEINNNKQEHKKETQELKNTITNTQNNLKNELIAIQKQHQEEINNNKQEHKKETQELKNTITNTQNKIQNSYSNLNKISSESNYANVFNSTVIGSKWLKKQNFALVNSAANYSFFYGLFRILDEMKPKNILELGLGQTTKMTAQYVYNSDEEIKLTVIDSDQSWINNFSKNLTLNRNTNIFQVNMEECQTSSGNKNFRYENFENLIKKDQFDLIIIDGPIGFNQKYPRTNILNIIENHLKEEFIIILDDYDRQGEKNTSQKIKDKLNNKNIKYDTKIFRGLKHQIVFFTQKYFFIKWY